MQTYLGTRIFPDALIPKVITFSSAYEVDYSREELLRESGPDCSRRLITKIGAERKDEGSRVCRYLQHNSPSCPFADALVVLSSHWYVDECGSGRSGGRGESLSSLTADRMRFIYTIVYAYVISIYPKVLKQARSRQWSEGGR